jgi:Integrase core domain
VEFWPGAGRAQRCAAPPPSEQAHQASGTYAHDNRCGDQQHLDQLRDSGPPGLCRSNAHAERFVLTARTQATDRMLIFGERHLRKVLAEYARHHSKRRPHRSRHLHPLRPNHLAVGLSRERIKRRSVPGGLINEYERAT